MADDLDEQSQQGFDLQYYFGVARRRHLHFLLPLFIGWAAVWTASWVLPPRYQSSTLILVEEPAMPREYVTPNVNDNLQERLQSITQQILSRTRLVRIIEQFNLYSRPHGQLSSEAKVDQMRKDIDIELVRDTRNQVSAFNVYFTFSDPSIAQKVTSELTNLFINENLSVRQHQSEDTTRFLEEQLATSRTTLSAQEDKIRQFKTQHVGEMPAQLNSNLQILSGLQSQLQNEEDALTAAKQQHAYLQTLRDQYAALQGPSKADGTALGLPAIDQQLERVKAQLSDLRSRYTDRHPDVRKLKEQVTATEAMREDLLASLKNTPQSASDANDSSSIASQIQDPRQASMLLQIKSQLRSNEMEIKNREHSILVLQAKIEGYQARLNQEPIREQQLADLTRGYEQSKANYDELLKKKNESAMATSMELLQQGERFRIMDPPSFPQKPVFPNRLKFCSIGLALGLALGLGVVGVCEVFDDRLHDVKKLRKLLPAQIVGEIPVIVNDSDLQSAKRRTWLGWGTAIFVLGSILAGSAFSYLRG